MSDQFMGEVRMFSFGFAPYGWAKADGSLMQVNQNQALFSLFGTAYGGDGRTTFGIPDLLGRVPMCLGSAHNVPGEKAGEAAHVLTQGEIPLHSHSLQSAQPNGDFGMVINNVFAPTANQMYHALDSAQVSLNQACIGQIGGGQPHENMMPYETIFFAVAIQGNYPH